MPAAVSTHGWSIIESAATHSQLAGVLAGFLFTGIVFLFGRTNRDNNQTIALVTATFFVLALDSYEYSIIAGNKPAIENLAAQCSLIWSQMMPAAGSLGVGAMALSAAVAWMLAGHVEAQAGHGPDRALYRLGGLVVSMMIGGAMLLLIATSLDYLESAYGERPLIWGIVTPVFGLAIMAASMSVAVRRTVRLTGSAGAPLALPQNLPIATYATIVYGIICLVFTGVISLMGVDSNEGPNVVVVAGSLLLGLLAPGGVGILIARSVPTG
ncbi:hypothetical protein ACWEKR_29915 [Nocardia sp. NPDC004573]